MVQHAEQEITLEERCAISVMGAAGGYRLSGAGQPDQPGLSLADAFAALFARLHDHAMRRFPHHTRIHAASGMGAGGLILLVGEKWAGKTTLAVHLLLEGFDMVGDELVLLRQGQAITFPRQFYLRHSALTLLPKLHRAVADAPCLEAEDGRLIALNPPGLGRPWRIRPAPVRAVLYLEPNHGGRSSVAPCSKTDMVRRVLQQSSPPASGEARWLSDLCGTINQSDCMIARVGSLASASEALRPFFGLSTSKA